MKGTFPIHKFRELRTPFYYYDTKVLRDTLSCIRTEAARYGNYSVHYAVKANANPKVLAIIRENGLGADCVSGGEIRAAIKAGFPTGLHTIEKGQSLYSIASMYGVSQSDIIKLNPGSDEKIFIGRTLRIPRSAANIQKKHTIPSKPVRPFTD